MTQLQIALGLLSTLLMISWGVYLHQAGMTLKQWAGGDLGKLNPEQYGYFMRRIAWGSALIFLGLLSLITLLVLVALRYLAS